MKTPKAPAPAPPPPPQPVGPTEQQLDDAARQRRELERMRTGTSDLRVENRTGLSLSRSQRPATGLSLNN